MSEIRTGEHIAFIGIGSNIGGRLQNILKAIRFLDELENVRVDEISGAYETAPVGVTEQADYINAVVKIVCKIEPEVLLDGLQAIENRLGRTRTIKWGPRTIDLDILCYDDRIVNTNRLFLPHKELVNRRFVLEPLHELAPNLVIPGVDKTVLYLLENVSDNSRINLILTSSAVKIKLQEV